MKRLVNKLPYLLFIVVPLILVVCYVILSTNRGPYYLATNSDPEYAYLLNSLKITQGEAPFHIDHPGTTLQLIGSSILTFTNLGNGKENLIDKVLINPEKYLKYFSIVIFTIVLLVDVFVGFYAYKISNNLFESLIIQASPLISIQPILELGRVRPDTLLIPTTLILAVLIFRIIYRPINSQNIKKYILAFGIVCGFAMVTKINFFPLLFLPIILLPKIINKIKFILVTILTFVFLTLPIISEYSKLFEWVFNLFIHSEFYGNGEKNIININTFVSNILTILSTEIIISVIFLLTLVFTIIILAKSLNKNRMLIKHSINNHIFKIIICVLMVLVFQVLLVSKQFSPHYLIPCLMLTGLSLVLLHKLVIGLINLKYKFNFILLVLGLILLFLNNTSYFSQSVSNLQKSFEGNIKITQFVEQLDKKIPLVYYYRNGKVEYALKFGNEFADNSYSLRLEKLYPNQIFYNIWNGKYYNYTKEISFEDVLGKSEIVYYYGMPFSEKFGNSSLKPKLNLVDIYNGGDQTIYIVKDVKKEIIK